MHVRTVAAIMMWFVVALLVLNNFFLRSALIWLISVAMMVVAVLVYFIPRLTK